MNAFGRRNGLGGMAPGSRPAFGVARPLKGGIEPAPRGQNPASPHIPASTPVPGEPGSFAAPHSIDDGAIPSSTTLRDDAMTRLA
ncbi:MAG: hypothetical protein N2038_00530, partial [Geminicoccaceae bacterium]|nr:hypothetical protein [Geminicoccaceae bacterium]